jgi:hypothetical protein
MHTHRDPLRRRTATMGRFTELYSNLKRVLLLEDETSILLAQTGGLHNSHVTSGSVV